MKRFLAGIAALLTMVSLVSCGSNETTSEATKSPSTITSSGNKDSSDNEADDEREDYEDYEDDYSDDNPDKSETGFTDESDIETQLKDLLQKKIDAALNDDFDTFCSYSSANFWKNIFIEQGEENVTDDDVTDWINDVVMDGFKEIEYAAIETGIESSEIYDFKIEDETKESENGITIKLFEVTFKLKSNSGYVLGEVELISYDNELDIIEIGLVDENSDRLKTANSNAKVAYNITAGYLADMEIQGFNLDEVLYEEGGEVDCTSVSYSNKLSEEISECFIEDESGGIVFVGTYKDGFFVQWKSSYDSEVVGQYPNPNGDVNNQYTWGSYGNYEY